MLSSYMKVCVYMFFFAQLSDSVCVCSVDDGSGVLNCTQWRRLEDSSNGLYVPSIGELVSIFGRVEEYRGEKQLKVTAIGTAGDALVLNMSIKPVGMLVARILQSVLMCHIFEHSYIV